MWFLVAFLIAVAAFSPVIPLYVAEYFHKLDYVNESNSVIATLPWLLFVTVPIGAVALLGWIVYGFYLLWS